MRQKSATCGQLWIWMNMIYDAILKHRIIAVFSSFSGTERVGRPLDQHAKAILLDVAPDASNTSRHTADQRRCRTISYDVIRCQQNAGNVALKKPDFTRNVRNGLQSLEKLQNFTSFTLDLFLWEEKTFLVKLCVLSPVKFCKPSTSHTWWVKGLDIKNVLHAVSPVPEKRLSWIHQSPISHRFSIFCNATRQQPRMYWSDTKKQNAKSHISQHIAAYRSISQRIAACVEHISYVSICGLRRFLWAYGLR